MQRLELTHEHISLVYIDVADILKAEGDRLYERARAHVVQKRAPAVRGEKRRVHEAVRGGHHGEDQPGPGPEVPALRISVVERRKEFVCAILFLVRRRVGRHLAGGTVAGQAPDILLPTTGAIVDEISVLVLAAGRERNRDERLQTRRESLVSQGEGKVWVVEEQSYGAEVP